MTTSRREQRYRFTQPTRLALLEDDADELESALKSLERQLSNARNALVLTVVSICTSMFFVVLDIILRR